MLFDIDILHFSVIIMFSIYYRFVITVTCTRIIIELWILDNMLLSLLILIYELYQLHASYRIAFHRNPY